MRILNVPPPEPRPVPQLAQVQLPHPVQARLSRPAHAIAAPPAPAGGSPPSMPAVATQLAHLTPKTQILIQPDAPPDVLLQHPIPLPLALQWTPPANLVKTIVPPPRHETITGKIRPSTEAPNREPLPADFKMASSNVPNALAKLAPSTTTPIVVRSQEPAKGVPETSSKQQDQPTPAQVMSLSDLQVKQGPSAIPLANAPAKPSTSQVVAAGPAANTAGAGRGNPNNKQVGAGSGASSGSSDAKSPATQQASSDPSGPIGPASSGDTGSGLEGYPASSITRVHVAKDGQFGFVVVGSTIADQYPETVGIWGGRLVYSVYLHLGPGKAWILQYALPAAAQVASNFGGTRPEAPWPFDIVQPHLDPADYTSDAIMVHGFVNLAGRFERLAVVFPTDFAQTKFVLSALQQWQFRPARQNGQLASVEVLLIIPEQDE